MLANKVVDEVAILRDAAEETLYFKRQCGRSCLRPYRINQLPTMAVFSRKRVHRPPEEVKNLQTVLRNTQVTS